jgi:hypothetical protein
VGLVHVHRHDWLVLYAVVPVFASADDLIFEMRTILPEAEVEKEIRSLVFCFGLAFDLYFELCAYTWYLC